MAETFRLWNSEFILLMAPLFMPRGLVPLMAQGLRALGGRLKGAGR